MRLNQGIDWTNLEVGIELYKAPMNRMDKPCHAGAEATGEQVSLLRISGEAKKLLMHI